MDGRAGQPSGYPISFTFIWKTSRVIGSILRMFKPLIVMFSISAMTFAADLPTRKQLNLATIKTMVAGAEAEAKRQNVEVTICIVDESGNLLFLEKADSASINTIEFARKKAWHAAFYKSPSREGAEAFKKGNLDVLTFPDFFPTRRATHSGGWTNHRRNRGQWRQV